MAIGDAGQVNGPRRWCLGVRIRQPAVQWNHRHFHRKRDKEAQHQQVFNTV